MATTRYIRRRLQSRETGRREAHEGVEDAGTYGLWQAWHECRCEGCEYSVGLRGDGGRRRGEEQGTEGDQEDQAPARRRHTTLAAVLRWRRLNLNLNLR